MRFMVIVKATKDSEAGVMPSEQLLTEMGKFNEELVKAGVMLAGEGLQPSSKGLASDSRATSGPSSTGRSPKRRSWLPASGCGSASRWPRRSSGSRSARTRIRARVRDRDSPGLRDGRFRRRVDAGTARAGNATREASGREREEVMQLKSRICATSEDE